MKIHKILKTKIISYTLVKVMSNLSISRHIFF